MRFQRHFLARRRIDFWLLAAGFAAVSVMSGVGKLIFPLFCMGGVYLALGRPRSWERFPPAFTLSVAAYCVWTVGLSVLRGEPVAGNRQLGYSAIAFASLFLPLCVCLIRHPLDAMVAGCRVGVVLLFVAAPIDYLWLGGRVGLGGNEAILAFMAAAAGIVARIHATDPPRFLPNGRWWTYASLLPVLLTQTRAAWGVFLLVVFFDLWALARRRLAPGRGPRLTLATVGVAALAASVPLSAIVVERVSVGLAEIERYEATGEAVGSLDVRLVMLDSGLELLAAEPFTGVGSTVRVSEVAALSGDNEGAILAYTHLHNLFLDEALSHGLVGLGLLGAVFLAFLVTVFRGRATRTVRESTLLMLFLIFSFGSFHGVLINEWTLIIIFGFMTVTLTEVRSARPSWSAIAAA